MKTNEPDATPVHSPQQDSKEEPVVAVVAVDTTSPAIQGAVPSPPPSDAVETEVLSEKDIAKTEKEDIVEKKGFDVAAWNPKTALGKQVKAGVITKLDDIFDYGMPILEGEIIDALVPNLSVDLLMIGQAKGKFGGGQRRVFKQTQKKTSEGNKPHFSTLAVVGNSNGHVGLGRGKAKETVPAREKSLRDAKLHMIKIRRGCGSWQCHCATPHSIPFMVHGRCGSVQITLIPAPKGTGLCIHKECAKMLRLAGIKDVWSQTEGHTKSTLNLAYACFSALQQLVATKVQERSHKTLGILEGAP